jgi:Domain of unknown function (DUF4340)
MSQRRFASLLVVAVLAIAGALYLSSRRDAPASAQGGIFLPYLVADMGNVSKVTILKGGPAPRVSLDKRADGWVVDEKGNYPADVSKIRKLLLALHDTKIVEQKTSTPANFASIGVDDPASANATGTQVNLMANGVAHAVIIGKSVGDGNFARRVGENTSYSIEPAVSIDSEPRLWIDNRLFNLALAAIQSVELKPSAGPAYTLRRTGPGDSSFALEGVPAGRKALDTTALAPSATTYSSLSTDDVVAASDVDFGAATAAIVTLSDGNAVTLTGVVVGDKHWVQIKMSNDAAFNAKANGRAFELTGYRYDAIFRSLDQLLVPKEPLRKKAPPDSSS